MAVHALANGNPAGPPDFSLADEEYAEKPLNDMSASEKNKLDVSEDLMFLPSDWQTFQADFLTYVDIHFDKLGSIYIGPATFPVQLLNELQADADDRKGYFSTRKTLASCPTT